MALDSYANLKTALQTWMARADLSNDVDDLIDIFEGWCNRNLRVPQMEQEATASATEYMPLPTDFVQLRDIQWQGSPRRQLEYVTPSYADIYDNTGTAGTPKYYTVVANQLRLIPAPDSPTSIRIDYWQKLPALSAETATNWLLALYPDAYLYGPMVHGHVRIHNPQMATTIASGWAGVMREIDKAGRNQNFGSLLQIRPA
jgi:hypothetical protein